MNQQTNPDVLVERLPNDMGHFQYLTTAVVKPSPAEAMAEEREVRIGWLTHPQISIGSGQRMIDIGSRYGEYTLTALALGVDHVYAFEKDIRLVKALRENLRLNGHSYVERCSVLNRTVSPIGMNIDNYIFNECSAVPENIKWIIIDVGSQDELNIVQGCYKTIEYYKPINVLIHMYNGRTGFDNFTQLFLAANNFEGKTVSIPLKDDEIIVVSSII